MILYQVDAFTDKLFGGNPAAVLILDDWPDDNLMQSIANENNLAETAFVVPEDDDYRIRWFTPATEVDLCGHATLAAAFIMFSETDYNRSSIRFQSKSGMLSVYKENDWLTLDFPSDEIRRVEISSAIKKCINAGISEAYQGRSDLMVVLEKENDVKQADPDLPSILQLGNRGLILTAPGTDVDFVSRFFAPYVGIDEDLVTGSAHTTLTPYWSKRLGKSELTARQISSRGGYLQCSVSGDRILISGRAVLYPKGTIMV